MARKNKKNEPITLDKEAKSTNDNITSSVATPGSMVVNGIDVSLPYDEYVAEFRRKYPRAQPMSKYNYELAQENAMEAKKAMEAKEANEGKPDWWTQPGEAEKIVEKITGKPNPTKEEVSEKANEIIERRITPDQQGIQSKGNEGDDNINNPDALDTSEIAKLQNELKSMAQTEENMEPGTMTFTPEQVEEAKNNAGITKEVPGSTSANNALTDSVSEAVTPKKDDPPGVVSDKNKYNKAMMSIWDAYRAGEISKETAGYFTIDAIATLAKNLGRSIGNVGAQFSGGTIDNGHDDSKWGQRQNALLNEEIGMETESLGGAAGRKAENESLDNQAKRIRNAYTPAQLEQQIEMFKKDLEMADINLDMAHSRTDLINFIKSDPEYAKSPFKMGLVAYLTQTGAAGAANDASKTLGDAINWILTIAK